MGMAGLNTQPELVLSGSHHTARLSPGATFASKIASTQIPNLSWNSSSAQILNSSLVSGFAFGRSQSKDCPSSVVIAVIKHHEQKQQGEERVCSAYSL